MRFFEEQRKARQSTFWLVLYFLLFVTLISGLIGFCCAVMFSDPPAHQEQSLPSFIYNKIFWGTFLINASLIVGVSLFKLAKIKSGDDVARMLGGTPINGHPSDEKEKRLLNIVEEMSIASGTPIPKVYVLKEQLSVNAFAAGWEPKNSVIAVTQGSLDLLDRDEMQGVIAHEFSHILNGDMLLNMRLVGIISGLVFITNIGEGMLRGSRGSRSSRRGKGGGGGAQIAGLALAFYILGGIGVFGARMIQSAVSRQRELLADASAAQFTRNPQGLARALAKIYHGIGSYVRHEHTQELSHLFFSNAVKFNFGGFATHPPLEKRIQLLDKNLNLLEFGQDLKISKEEVLKTHTHIKTENLPKRNAHEALLGAGGILAPAAIIATIGQPTFLNVEVSKRNIEKIPTDILKAARDPEQALSVLLGLVLENQSPEIQQRVLSLSEQQDASSIPLIKNVKTIAAESFATSFILLQISLGSLRTLSIEEKHSLLDSLKNIFSLDGFTCFSETLYGLYIQDTLTAEEQNKPYGNLKFENILKDLDTFTFWFITDGKSFDSLSAEEKEQAKSRYLNASLKYNQSPSNPATIPAISFEKADEIRQKIQNLNLRGKSKVVETLWRNIQGANSQADPKFVENLRLLCSLCGAPVPAFMQNL